MATDLSIAEKRESDLDFLHSMLERGPATNHEILVRSFQERGCGLTIHSRAASLRDRLRPAGLTVASERVGTNDRRPVWRYSIVTVSQQASLFDDDYEDAYEPDDPKLVTLRRDY